MRRHLQSALFYGLLSVICGTVSAEPAVVTKKVTAKPTAKPAAPPVTSAQKPAAAKPAAPPVTSAQKPAAAKPAADDYPALCRMAEANGDAASAWSFAEKWAASRDPELRKSGIVKLLELALNRDPATLKRTMARAEEAGVTPEQLNLWKVRRDLRRKQYAEAIRKIDPVISQGGLSQQDLSRALQMKTQALIGMKRYQEAAESSEERLRCAPDRAAMFDARCQQIYALNMAKQFREAQNLVTAVQADYPEFADALNELRMMLAVQNRDWKTFRQLFDAHAKKSGERKGSSWYFTACRIAAGQAETREQALKLRQAALQAASSDQERSAAMLDVLQDLEQAAQWTDMAEMIRIHLECYPNVPNRGELELRAARYLVKAAKLRAALMRYDAILKRELPGISRFEVALEAADQCAGHNRLADEQRYIQWAMMHAQTQAQHQEGCFRLGQMYSRRGMHDKAQKAYHTAAETKGPRSEEARFFCMQELIRIKAYGPATAEALALCAAKNPRYQAAANYHLANLLELTGKSAEAAKEYLRFAAAYPQSEFMPAALYNAAMLTEKTGNDAASAERLKAFVKACPKHALTGNALFKLMLHQERLSQFREAEATAEQLMRDFSRSPFASAAFFRLTDRAVLEKRYSAGLEYLDRIEAQKPDFPGIQARLLFDRAAIHARLENPRKALELLEKVLAMDASAPVAADAAQLAGYLHTQLGEYAAAAVHYARAAQLRPGGAFAENCMERKADGLYAGGTAAGRPDLIRLALQEYRNLQNKGLPMAPLLFKSGRCYEELGQKRDALKAYSELLYRAAAARTKGVRPDPFWCSKALYAAVRIDRAMRSLDGARHAVRLIVLARSMGLELNGECQAVERELCRKYKL